MMKLIFCKHGADRYFHKYAQINLQPCTNNISGSRNQANVSDNMHQANISMNIKIEIYSNMQQTNISQICNKQMILQIHKEFSFADMTEQIFVQI